MRWNVALAALVLFVASASAQRRQWIGESTRLELREKPLCLLGVCYRGRLAVEHVSGPQWREINGVGVIYISSDDPVYRIVYDNLLKEGTTMHQHGLTSVMHEDGVSYIGQWPIQPDRSHRYEFPIPPHNMGTYFVHSHWGFHHASGLSVPLIVEGKPPKGYPDAAVVESARDVMMYMEDFCPFVYNHSSGENPSCTDTQAVFHALQERWDSMVDDFNWGCQEPLEIMDLEFRHHLVNERSLLEPATASAAPGETVRLRVISSASFMNYRLDFNEFDKAVVIAADGQWVHPHDLATPSSDQFTPPGTLWMAPAQRYDVLVTVPTKPGRYVIYNFAGGSYHQQGGLVIVVGGESAPPRSFSPVREGDFVWMYKEPMFRAWYPLPPRKVDRELVFNVTGDNGFMAINKYSWTMPPMVPHFENNPYPLEVKEGERVCITINNFSPWAHPWHLHGHSFAVSNIREGSLGVGTEYPEGTIRDTVQSTKGCGSTRICFDADNPGVWPLHCHKDLHMAAGMISTLEYKAGGTTGITENPMDIEYLADDSKLDMVHNFSTDMIVIPRTQLAEMAGHKQGHNALINGVAIVCAFFAVVAGAFAIKVGREKGCGAEYSNLETNTPRSRKEGADLKRLLTIVFVFILVAAIVGVAALLLGGASAETTGKFSGPFLNSELLDALNSDRGRDILSGSGSCSGFVTALLDARPFVSSEQFWQSASMAVASLSLPALADCTRTVSFLENSQLPLANKHSIEALAAAYNQRFGLSYLHELQFSKETGARATLTPAEAEIVVSDLTTRILNTPAAEVASTTQLLERGLVRTQLRHTLTTEPSTDAVPPSDFDDRQLTITTHVLDIVSGRPAAGVQVKLEIQSTQACGWSELATGVTNQDGRFRFPSGPRMTGSMRVVFMVGGYFASVGSSAFYRQVEIPFETEMTEKHYHVPIVLSNYGYSTYRGS